MEFRTLNADLHTQHKTYKFSVIALTGFLQFRVF